MILCVVDALQKNEDARANTTKTGGHDCAGTPAEGSRPEPKSADDH